MNARQRRNYRRKAIGAAFNGKFYLVYSHYDIKYGWNKYPKLKKIFTK